MEKFKEKARKLNQKFVSFEDLGFMTSGSVIGDAVIGGGLPVGKFIEVSSDSGVGKTTWVLHACKVNCAQGKKIAYLDYEHGVNESQLEGVGLKPYLGENFFLYSPVTFEDGEEIIDSLKEEGVDIICIDSVTAMLPARAVDKSVGDLEPGLHARYSATFLQKYKAVSQLNKITFIFINQVRTKLNFRGMSTQQAAGGNAQKFYMDVRLEMRKVKRLEKQMDTLEGRTAVEYGAEVAVWAIKNRYNNPFIEGIMTIYYGKGVSNLAAYIRWMLAQGHIVQGGGGWYTIKWDEKEEKVRGQEGLMNWVKDNGGAVKKLIEDNGGFLLLKESDESE